MFKRKHKDNNSGNNNDKDVGAKESMQGEVASTPAKIASGDPASLAKPTQNETGDEARKRLRLEKKEARKVRRAQKKGNKWRGLLSDAPLNQKVIVFVALFLISTSLVSIQFGFLYLPLPGDNYVYLMTPLAFVAVASLLLGKGWGALEGVFAGSMLCLHAGFQPLDIYEKYLVTAFNSIVGYALAGLLLGLMFARALRNDPKGTRRIVYIAIVCMIVSILVTAFFAVFGIMSMAVSEIMNAGVSNAELVQASSDEGINVLTRNLFITVASMGSLVWQVILDALLMVLACVIAEQLIAYYHRARAGMEMYSLFSSALLVVVFMAFSVLGAVSFVAITMEDERDAYNNIGSEVSYVADQLEARVRQANGIKVDDKFEDLPKETIDSITELVSISTVVDGYSLDMDGTLVIFYDDSVIISDSPAYPAGVTTAQLFGLGNENIVKDVAQSNNMVQILYNELPYEEVKRGVDFNSSVREIGYMRAQKTDDFYVMMALPSSKVFENRNTTIAWISITVLVLLVLVYMLSRRLLTVIVVRPIGETNQSLARITDGQLDEVVDVNTTIEFMELSKDINTTVDALKDLIDQAERSMQKDLATAKAIQESALPRTFPPFPEIDAFDIYASMNAAKEVGGDFFDFFLVDDHTLGFLIADVSGKGIPGALFMMTAKTELENYMQTGMDLDQAIAGVNARLCANNDAGMFVTVWAATLDYQTGELTYVNAGHNFPLRRHDGSWEWIKEKCGLFLGTFEKAKYKKKTLTMEEGDQLVLYTDGVNEAFNVNEEEYGNDRLEAFLAAHNKLSPRALVEELRADVALWATGAEQSDDITILCLEYGIAPVARAEATFEAVLENVNAAIEFVNTELIKRLCPPVVLNKVDVAMEELLVNVCRYAYADQDEPGQMTVSYLYTGDPTSITVQIVDQGVPFDPVSHEDPSMSKNIDEVQIGGLGIFMVRRMMDDFAYLYDEETSSNVVVMRKTW